MKIPEIQISYSFKQKKGDRIKLCSSKESFKMLIEIFDPNIIELQEEFIAIYLNRAHEVLGYRRISVGGIAGTIVDLRILFGIAVKGLASAMIIAHNHPSGSIAPSKEDLALTDRIIEGSAILNIRILDHLIVTKEEYYSMADEGVL